MSSSQQSPINIANPVRATFRPDVLRRHWAEGVRGFLSPDTSHGLKILFQPDPNSFVAIGGKRYQLASFHFHHPSEHYLGGRQFDVELHVVHQDLADLSFAVLAVFIEVDPKGAHDGLKGLHEALKRRNPVQDATFDFSTNPNDWVPSHVSHFYRYQGSLTTEPFSEDVTWTVFNDPLVGTREQVETLIGEAKSHARGLQPLNRRYIIEYGRPKPRAK